MAAASPNSPEKITRRFFIERIGWLLICLFIEYLYEDVDQADHEFHRQQC